MTNSFSNGLKPPTSFSLFDVPWQLTLNGLEKSVDLMVIHVINDHVVCFFVGAERHPRCFVVAIGIHIGSPLTQEKWTNPSSVSTWRWKN